MSKEYKQPKDKSGVSINEMEEYAGGCYPTREEAFKAVNDTQEYYVNELVKLLLSPVQEDMKEVFFTSDTGTGKTRMIGMLSQKMPDCCFFVTTLSRGSLDEQTHRALEKYKNVRVRGVAQLKSNTRLTSKSLEAELTAFAGGKKLIWIRDEGHQKTCKWRPVLDAMSYRIINFSATNSRDDIRTNFVDTIMLRTPEQQLGTPQDAIKKLMEIKRIHEHVKNYNPCALFRCTNDKILPHIISACKKYGLKYIDKRGNAENATTVEELCMDDNPYDVIITYQKFVEGIDIGRAHVIYIQNTPKNQKTTVQLIGRCRRNALWNRDAEKIGIDIYSESNRNLFDATKICYVYYNRDDTYIPRDENKNLLLPTISTVSVQELRVGATIYLKDGKMSSNGLHIAEAGKSSGKFIVATDPETGFNVLERVTNKYYPIGAYATHTFDYSNNGVVLPIRFYNKRKNNGDIIEQKMTLETWLSLKPKKVDYSYWQLWSGKYVKKKCYSVNYYGVEMFLPISENKDLPLYGYYPYTKIMNDKELAIIGIENFRYMQRENEDGEKELTLVEDTAVTSRLCGYTKLRRFIENKYSKQLNEAKPQLFSGKNDFGFTDGNLNKCLGYMVEYYSKYKVYGVEYLRPFTSIATHELGEDWSDGHALFACFLKYQDVMKRAFGDNVARCIISSDKMKDLIEKNYDNFIYRVVKMGTATAEFVKKNLDGVEKITFGDNIYDPRLSTEHLTALCDYIGKNTIIDIKAKNHIGETDVMQVLAYHYLSTKRSDLDVHNLIIYDATSGRSVTMHV